MAAYPEKVQRVLDEGYEFRLSDYINQGFKLMQRNTGEFIAFIVVFFLVSLTISMVTSGLTAVLTLTLGPIPAALISQGINAIGSTLVTAPLMAGFYHVCKKVDFEERHEFSNFFDGFKKWKELVLNQLIMTLLFALTAIPGLFFIFQSGLDFNNIPYSIEDLDVSKVLIGTVLIAIPIVYLSVSYMWAPMFVWFFDMKAWDALEASRKIISQQWLWCFLFALAVGFIGAAGVLACIVGLLYTLPAMYCAAYASFADVLRLGDSEDPQQDIIDHFAPQP